VRYFYIATFTNAFEYFYKTAPAHLGIRIEWCKSYSRVRRWREEILSLQEEIRRCPVSLEWHAKNWESKAEIDTFEGERWEGSSAYAHAQAAVRRKIKDRFEDLWSTEQFKKFLQFKPGNLDLETIFDDGDGEEIVEEEVQADDDDDEEEDEAEEGASGEAAIEGEEFEETNEDMEVDEDGYESDSVGTMENTVMEILRNLEEEREE
jgi:hypothetical protein